MIFLLFYPFVLIGYLAIATDLLDHERNMCIMRQKSTIFGMEIDVDERKIPIYATSDYRWKLEDELQPRRGAKPAA
jgi:hypothetical protein